MQCVEFFVQIAYNISKKESDIIEKYKYDFGIVNDEDVSVPDFSGYKVEYQNWNMSDIGK